MKKRFYTSVLVSVFLLSTCILTGCSDSEKSNSMEGNDKKIRSASVDMSSWPDGLPKFKGGKLFQVLNDEDTGVLAAAVFSNIKNPETAYKNYKTALINSGWVLDVDTSNEYVWGGAYLKDSKDMLVTVQKDGSAAQLMYSAE